MLFRTIRSRLLVTGALVVGSVFALKPSNTVQRIRDAATGRMKDTTVLCQLLVAKVALIRDEELAKLLPARVTVVEIEFSDGTKLAERVTAVRGTVRNPMTRDEVIAKARDLTEPVLGADRAQRLIEAVSAIEAMRDVREMGAMLRG